MDSSSSTRKPRAHVRSCSPEMTSAHDIRRSTYRIRSSSPPTLVQRIFGGDRYLESEEESMNRNFRRRRGATPEKRSLSITDRRSGLQPPVEGPSSQRSRPVERIEGSSRSAGPKKRVVRQPSPMLAYFSPASKQGSSPQSFSRTFRDRGDAIIEADEHEKDTGNNEREFMLE